MNKLILGSLVLAAASQAAGCIITTDDGDEFAIVTAEWAVKSSAGQTLTCPPGITVAAIYAQEVNANYARVGAPYITTYDCGAGFGNTQPLPPSVYEMWVELTMANGTVYATSTSKNEIEGTNQFPRAWFVDVVDVDKTFRTTLLADGGYFQFDWDLRDSATNAPITCADVPKVAILSTSVTNANNSFDDRFNCDDGNSASGEGFGMTGGLLQGAYTLQVSAANATGQGLGPATMLLNKEIKSPNKVTNLGTVMVRVD